MYALHQCRNMAAVCSCDKVTFPVAPDGRILNGGWPLADRYRIHYLSQPFPFKAGMYGATCCPLGSQVRQKLFFKHSTGLIEQTPVDGFV